MRARSNTFKYLRSNCGHGRRSRSRSSLRRSGISRSIAATSSPEAAGLLMWGAPGMGLDRVEAAVDQEGNAALLESRYAENCRCRRAHDPGWRCQSVVLNEDQRVVKRVCCRQRGAGTFKGSWSIAISGSSSTTRIERPSGWALHMATSGADKRKLPGGRAVSLLGPRVRGVDQSSHRNKTR